MPIERSSLQFKMWLLFLVISALMVFVAFKALEGQIDKSFSENAVQESSFGSSEDYLSVESNETIEESLFGEFETQKSLFFIMIIVLPLAFVMGFVLKFLHERKKEK